MTHKQEIIAVILIVVGSTGMFMAGYTVNKAPEHHCSAERMIDSMTVGKHYDMFHDTDGVWYMNAQESTIRIVPPKGSMPLHGYRESTRIYHCFDEHVYELLMDDGSWMTASRSTTRKECDDKPQ